MKTDKINKCEFCQEEKDILNGEIDRINNICFVSDDKKTITIGELKELCEEEELRIFIDRGHLRVTQGDDIGCLDHSIDYVKINFCPMCGSGIN